MNRNRVHDCLLFVVCVGLIVLFCRPRNTIEHMAVNEEALSNLASMYQSGTLKVSNLEVTGKTTMKGALDVTGKATMKGDLGVNGNAKLHKPLTIGSVKLASGAGGSLRVQTPHGWGEFGPQNRHWLHIMTDRPKIYAQKPTHVHGNIKKANGKQVVFYDDNLGLINGGGLGNLTGCGSACGGYNATIGGSNNANSYRVWKVTKL